MAIFLIRSVLGDVREAEVNPGDGYPWINCPFCSSAIYLEGPHPDAPIGACFIARDGRCANPWCLANPAMPIDAARLARGNAILAEMAEAARRANHEAALARIREEQEARQSAWNKIRAEAEATGACIPCAWHAWSRQGKGRLVRHRGPCPKTVSRSQK